jgi:hypothetical protein
VPAGDKAVLSCETDAYPEPTVTWYKDQQPLALVQRMQVLQGGQRLEILASQVSSQGQHGGGLRGGRWQVYGRAGGLLLDMRGDLARAWGSQKSDSQCP